MGQSPLFQAEAHRTTLTQAAARDQMQNPLSTDRRGAVQSLTITVPLITERNSYLVVRLPANVVQDLLAHVGTLPEDQRRNYLSEWIIRNQQTVLEQYLHSGRSSRPFRYDVVPARMEPPVGEAVPRRVEQQPPPVANAVPRREETSPHRLIEVIHVWNPAQGAVPRGWLGTTPDGWRAPATNELPQEVRTRANVLRPRSGPGQVPLGDGRIEEFNGRRYLYLSCYHTVPAPTHEAITVFVQAEQAARAPAVQGPAPDLPRERPVAAPPQREREEDREVRSGSGTRSSPFQAYVLRDRSTRNDMGGSEVAIPISFDVGGRVYFTVHVTVSQISNSKIDQTYGEIIRIARQTIGNMEDYRGGRVQLRQDLAGFRQSVRTSMASHQDVLRYMDSH